MDPTPSSQLESAVLALFGLTLVTGVLYPLAVTAVAQLALPHQANGSLMRSGSELVGQPFDGPAWFWSRPSATSPAYDGSASSGSNLGPTNPALLEAVRKRVAALRAAGAPAGAPVPVDLVTCSASGLDPDISPAAADYQIARVALARRIDPARVAEIVRRHVRPRQFGILGERRVNVLELNLDLEASAPR